MAKIPYYFDTETSSYKRLTVTRSDIAINSASVFILSCGIGLLLMLGYNSMFETPKERRLANEVKEMQFYFKELTSKIDVLSEELAAVEDRDDNIYRSVLGSPKLDVGIRRGGSGGYARYAAILDKDLENGSAIVKLNEKVDKLRRNLYIETMSQDEVVKFSEKKERQFAAIPAIQPVSNKALIGIASGFGMRIHPIYKVMKPHTGIDFAAPPGTPVYATADGKVVAAEIQFDGYGKILIIDHGFGYVTRYAHMQDFKVAVGQTIKRGEHIGFVGNTGVSTAPHLHYEVLLNGEQIDPVNYFFKDLSPAEYEKVVELASIQNQSLGN